MMRRNNFLILGLSCALLTSGAALGFPFKKSEPAKSVSNEKFWKEYTAQENKPNSQPGNFLLMFQEQLGGLAQKILPSVVNIYSTVKTQQKTQSQNDLFRYFFEDFFKQQRQQQAQPKQQEVQSLGSGFIISEEGYIVTNAHVLIEGADSIKVKLGQKDKFGKDLEFEATIVGKDKASDVGLIKISPPKSITLQPIPLGNSDSSYVGHLVLAVGNPFGFSQTVTHGIISSVGRDIATLSPYLSYTQTDAAIHQGNSGGPLCNIHGEVIGINTAIRTPNIGFAIPINKVKKYLPALKKEGRVRRGWIGIALGPRILDGKIELQKGQFKESPYNTSHGVLVRDVIVGEPADKILFPDDVILKVNKTLIHSQQELLIAIGEIPVGKRAQIQIWRNNKIKNVLIRVSERVDSQQARINTAPSQKGGTEEKIIHSKLGIRVSPLSPQSRKQHNIPGEIKGIVVDFAERNSSLRAGDVISKANRRHISSKEGLAWILRRATKSVLLVVYRKEQSQYRRQYVWIDF